MGWCQAVAEPPPGLRPAPARPTSFGSFLAGATAGSLGLATGKEKSRSMLAKSGSTTGEPGPPSEAHMELCSAGEASIRPGVQGAGGPAAEAPHLPAPHVHMLDHTRTRPTWQWPLSTVPPAPRVTSTQPEAWAA